MKEKLTPTPILIETHNESSVEWGVSFSDHNPSPDKYVKCATKEETERLVSLIGSLMRGKYTNKDIDDAYDKGLRDSKIKFTIKSQIDLIEKYLRWEESQDELSADFRENALEFLITLY